MTFERIKKIHKKIVDTTIAVEEYVDIKDGELRGFNFCLFSYYFDSRDDDKFELKANCYLRFKGTQEWYKNSIDITISKTNNVTEDAIFRATNLGYTDIYGTRYDLSSDELVELIKAQLKALDEYLFGKPASTKWQKVGKPFKWLGSAFKESYKENALVYIVNAGYEAGMFLYNGKIANDHSELENKIKEVTTRKNVDTATNTLGMTKTILEGMTSTLPKGTLTVKNIELDGAFRISYE